jgi:hypothetical protein
MCGNFWDFGACNNLKRRGMNNGHVGLWPDIGLGSYPRHTTL